MTQESHPTSWLDEIPGRLAEIERAHLLRRRRVVQPAGGAHLLVDGQPMLAFCSNDYLGLASHPALAEAAREATHAFGDLAWRLIAGDINFPHCVTQKNLARIELAVFLVKSQ